MQIFIAIPGFPLRIQKFRADRLAPAGHRPHRFQKQIISADKCRGVTRFSPNVRHLINGMSGGALV